MMNPQGPFNGQQQSFPPNKAPPTQGSFQNVPLGPSKPGGPDMGPPRPFAPQMNQFAPPQSAPNMRPPLSQLPPGQNRPPSSNGPPPTFVTQNGPAPLAPPQSAQSPLPPPSNQGQPQLIAPLPGQPGLPPAPQKAARMMAPMQTPQMGGNPITQPSQPGGNQFSQPPASAGNQFSQPPTSGTNQFTQSPPQFGAQQLSNQMQGMSVNSPYPGSTGPPQTPPSQQGPPLPGIPSAPRRATPQQSRMMPPMQPAVGSNVFGHPPPPGGNQFGQPPPPGGNQFGQPPPPGGNQFGQQPPPPGGNQFGQPPPPGSNQFGQPPPPGGNQFGQPPPPGGNQFGQPPLPGGNQFNQPPTPGTTQFAQPPPQFGAQPLSNQMQGVNSPYPGGPQKAMNGDNGLHMPPPLSQQGYMNTQNRQGYPPMPGPGQAPGQYPQPAYQQQQQQQQRRLDPDQMPSPIQVIQDDQANRSGIFYTNQKGLVPPLVSTKFVVQDQGYASPRLIRSTMYNVPITSDLIKQTAVPFGLVISPMARAVASEYAPPLVNFGELGPVRCIRCKAYMCPYMQFIDSGRRFQCLFCKASTDVPQEYFQHLDHTGQRMDRYERPELVLGTYEFTATKDYCRNTVFPKPPAIIFVIDVSYNNVKSGLVHLICSQMKEIIKNLPIDEGKEASNMRVGFITYNSTVHFYNIKGNLAAPQMLVVGDTQEMFMPLLDGFLCTPEESETVIDLLMEQIPNMFADTRECETILLPAILAGLEALKASECAGKLLVFHSTLPIAEAPGKLKNRDDRKLLGTDKERTVLTPQNQTYNQLGQDCVGSGCSVDLFLFNNAYIDVATIGQVSRLTGGEVYKYTYFQADIDGERLINDIITNINRPIAFDAIMRVRTSTGVRPTDFYGHCFMSNTTDMELAAIDCDKAVAIEIKHDDKLQEEEGIYIQVALLYTSVSGQRRLRIINQALKTCSQMADLYRSCDLETIINFFSKQAVHKLLDNNPKVVKDSIVQRAAQMLANYRKNCASPSSAGQLILPECMKLLPLYVNCLLKCDAIAGGADITLDDRSFAMQAVMTMDVPSSVSYFYPRLIPLHELKVTEEPVTIPAPIRCTIEKMTDQGIYILENGIHMFLWIGLGANQDFIQQVFGVPSAVQINIETVALPELKNPLSEAVRSIVDQVRAQRHRYMRLTMVRQKEKLETVFKHFLVEDRGLDGSPGYVDFLCHMHKEIRSLLS